jgi:hypothetical protein
VAIRIAAGQRREVIEGDESVGLVDQGEDGVADREWHRVGVVNRQRALDPLDAAACEDRLKGDAADVAAFEAVAEGVAEVQDRRRRHGHRERARHADRAGLIDRPRSNRPKVGAAEFTLPRFLRAVELDVELELPLLAPHAAEFGPEGLVGRDTHRVRVDEDVADRAMVEGPVEEIEEARVERRLAARELEDVDEALAVDHRLHAAEDVLVGTLLAVLFDAEGRRGVTGRAGEIAALDDLDQGDAGRENVEGIGARGRRRRRRRPAAAAASAAGAGRAGAQVPEASVLRERDLEIAVRRAALPHDDAAVDVDDPGGNLLRADRAPAAGRLEVGFVAEGVESHEVNRR